VAGPLATAVGVSTTLVLAAALSFASLGTALALPSLRELRRRDFSVDGVADSLTPVPPRAASAPGE
jgi:hypothetical protein